MSPFDFTVLNALGNFKPLFNIPSAVAKNVQRNFNAQLIKNMPIEDAINAPDAGILDTLMKLRALNAEQTMQKLTK